LLEFSNGCAELARIDAAPRWRMVSTAQVPPLYIT